MRARVAVPMLVAVAVLALAVAGWAFAADWHHFAAARPLAAPATSSATEADAGPPEFEAIGAASTAAHHAPPSHRATPTSPSAARRPAPGTHPAGTTPSARGPISQAPPARTTTTPPPAAAPIHIAPISTGDASAVFNELNSERAEKGLPALHWSSALASSAARHTQAMASANLLQHDLPGEPDFGTRISNAGYAWKSCGENIGENTDAVAVQRAFLAEGKGGIHYDNTMSSSFVDVGIAVVYSNGKYWVTEDFGQPQ